MTNNDYGAINWGMREIIFTDRLFDLVRLNEFGVVQGSWVRIFDLTCAFCASCGILSGQGASLEVSTLVFRYVFD